MKRDFTYFNSKKKRYELQVLVFGIISALGFIMFLPLGVAGGFGGVALPMISFMGGGIMCGISYSSFKKVSIEFKELFLDKELKKVFPNSTYVAREGFSSNEIYNSQVLKREDRFASEDMIIGKFEDVKFRSSDVTLKDVRRSGKSTTVVTVFQGRVYEFEFNKRFKANLLLIQPGKFRVFGPWKKIKMESIRFNSELKVYAEDDHEAFYILTPHFMEILLYLDRKYKDKINFSFINNKLYIAVDSRTDTFDIKLFKEISEDIIKDFVKEFEEMKEFIIKLKLDNKIFLLGDEY